MSLYPDNFSLISADKSVLRISANTISTLSNSARVSASTGLSRSSISMASTLSLRRASSFVSTPIPVPISIAAAPFLQPPRSAILGQTAGLMRKFCPSDFVKETPFLLITSLIVLIFVSSILPKVNSGHSLFTDPHCFFVCSALIIDFGGNPRS